MKHLVKTPVNYNGKSYEPGKVIDLDPEEAAEMPWAVEPVKAKAEPEPEVKEPKEPKTDPEAGKPAKPEGAKKK